MIVRHPNDTATLAVVPPRNADFSKIPTDAPLSEAARAAVNPAAPVPRTTTSNSLLDSSDTRAFLDRWELLIASDTISY